MIDSALLMRRAIRSACDQHGLAPDTLHLLPSDAKTKFQELCLVIADDMRYNQLRYFRPFPHQLNFFATAKSDRRETAL